MSSNAKDELFYQLLCDLAGDIVHDAQEAAEKTIDLSSHFLGSDGQHLVEDFRSLCIAPQQSGELDLVGQNIQELAQKNAIIRSEVNVVLGSMQFSEFLRQHLTAIQHSFEELVHNTLTSEQALRDSLQKHMHTYDERKAFHEKIMHEPMPDEDRTVTQDLIDQLIG